MEGEERRKIPTGKSYNGKTSRPTSRVSIGRRREEGCGLLSSVLQKESDVSGKKKKPLKRVVVWADEVGGELLNVFRSLEDAKTTLAASGKATLRDQTKPFNVYQQRGTLRFPSGGFCW